MTQYVKTPTRQIHRGNGTTNVTYPRQEYAVRDFQQHVGIAGKGTACYGVPVMDSGGALWVKLTDAIYNAIIAVNPTAFSDCTVQTSITGETPNTSAPYGANPCLHKQVILFIGDSIINLLQGHYAMDFFDGGARHDRVAEPPVNAAFVGSLGPPVVTMGSNIGSTLTVTSVVSGTVGIGHLVDQQGILPAGAGLSAIQLTGTTGGVGTYLARDVYPTVPSGTPMWLINQNTNYESVLLERDWTHGTSRFVLSNGVNGWFSGPVPPSATVSYYTSDGGFVYNHDMFTRLFVAPWQQVVLTIAIGTNDYDLNGDLKNWVGAGNAVNNSSPGALFGSPTQGNPNLVTGISGGQGALTDIIAAFKAVFPNGKVCVRTIIARNFGSTGPAGSVSARYPDFVNPQFSDYADYIIANRAALGIDVVYDTRAIPQYACNSPNLYTITTNNTYYVDGTHPQLFGARTLLNPPMRQMWDSLLLGDLSNLRQPMFYHG